MNGDLNVLGTPLEVCCTSPMTGWFRDGSCRTDHRDHGLHTVCCEVDEAFLTYTRSKGNDLSTPLPHFPGLKPGDKWCLCASRWLEAEKEGHAPRVLLKSTHEKTLTVIPLDTLNRYSGQPQK